MQSNPSSWDLCLNIITAAICGAFANRWYLWHAKRQIDRVRAEGLVGQHAKQALMKRGGTSVRSAIGTLLLYIFVAIAIITLFDLVRFGPDASAF